MGQPVTWEYTLTIAPTGATTRVTLHRVQRGTDTRFLWLQTTMPQALDRAEVDAVLQEIYTAVLVMMEISA